MASIPAKTLRTVAPVDVSLSAMRKTSTGFGHKDRGKLVTLAARHTAKLMGMVGTNSTISMTQKGRSSVSTTSRFDRGKSLNRLLAMSRSSPE